MSHKSKATLNPAAGRDRRSLLWIPNVNRSKRSQQKPQTSGSRPRTPPSSFAGPKKDAEKGHRRRRAWSVATAHSRVKGDSISTSDLFHGRETRSSLLKVMGLAWSRRERLNRLSTTLAINGLNCPHSYTAFPSTTRVAPLANHDHKKAPTEAETNKLAGPFQAVLTMPAAGAAPSGYSCEQTRVTRLPAGTGGLCL